MLLFSSFYFGNAIIYLVEVRPLTLETLPMFQEQNSSSLMPYASAQQEPSLKPFNRYEEEDEIQEVMSPQYTISPVVGSQFALPYPLELTVAKKASPVYNVGDFSITDPNDHLLFMVSARNESTRSKRVLLNSAGVPLLCAHRKMLSLYNRWDAFRGEQPKPNEALFSVKRSAYFQLKTSLHVFLASHKKDSKPHFKVKGNYSERKCTILHGSQIIAEVKRKCTDANLQLEKDTFVILVHPGIDYAFIVTLILIMDEIHREQDHSSIPPTRDPSKFVAPDSWRSL